MYCILIDIQHRLLNDRYERIQNRHSRSYRPRHICSMIDTSSIGTLWAMSNRQSSTFQNIFNQYAMPTYRYQKNDIWKNFGDIIDTVKLPIKPIVDKGIHIRQRIRPSFTCDTWYTLCDNWSCIFHTLQSHAQYLCSATHYLCGGIIHTKSTIVTVPHLVNQYAVGSYRYQICYTQ